MRVLKWDYFAANVLDVNLTRKPKLIYRFNEHTQEQLEVFKLKLIIFPTA